MVSQDAFAHGFDVLIGITSLHVLVAFERPLFLAVNRPEGNSINVDSLHFQGDIVGNKGYSFNSAGISHDRVPRANECFESDTSFYKVTVSNDNKPFIW